MKRFTLLVLLASGAFAQTAAGPKVYVMPMAAGFDQHLADWLTRTHAMQVVTDAKAAEVILTDRLGEGLEQRLQMLRPEEKAEPVAAKAADKKAGDAKTEVKEPVTAGAGSTPRLAFRTTAARGTLFLVDVRTRSVVWSGYQKNRATTDEKLNRQAERAVQEIQASYRK